MTMTPYFNVRSVVAAVLLAIGAVVISGSNADAQILSRGDLFGPGAPPPLVGIQVGVGNHQQQGDFKAACGCDFNNGSGTGFLGNLLFELPLNYDWVVGISAGIDFKNTTGRQAVYDTAVIQFPEEERDTINALGFNRVGTVKTTYISLSPFVQYQFFRMGPFLQGGVDVEFLVANHFRHDRELLSSDGTTMDGQVLHDLRFASTGTLEENVQDGPIPDVNSLRLGLLLSAGYNVAVSERSVLTPMLTYDLPLTTISNTDANGWKIGSLYASVVLKFKLD